ncbi:SPOR domain-containing protein [Clostridium sp. D53t1_180928_C8]|uniref:SPOR domain-containing protein n=1 Tax=Clostridium sp. D53t1_180928_C8 TaxID=2787101 RepID=UPI0018A92524|nr:SPOR domain-containing protein [Clostridium sp. D53t1_180928_C8]
MRYTRYNYKKKKNNDIVKLILSFIGMSAFVIIVGVLLANVIIHFLPINNATNGEAASSNEQSQSDNSENVNAEATNEQQDIQVNADVSKEVNNNEQASEVTQGTINTNFVAIQCGYFAEEGNAKETFNKISSGYGAFIYNDADKFKVLAGVYTTEEGQAVIDKLTASGIECAKVDFNLNSSNAVESQIAGIYDGYLEILDTAFKDDVKSVDTTDFKEWVSKLDDIKEGDKYEVLADVKKHINELGAEIKKENVANEMQYLYKVLLSFNK